uniref:5'-AMP-activated protein kinase subunit beta-1 n=1 Tax=Macrostomum lignano TaxID=282301 RepID=A0A1I8IG12_9PLAT
RFDKRARCDDAVPCWSLALRLDLEGCAKLASGRRGSLPFGRVRERTGLGHQSSVEQEYGFRIRAETISEQPGDHVTASKLPTVFKWSGAGKEVFLSGSFNNWQAKIPLVKSQDHFYTIVDLPEGEHEYQFIVDGKWQANPKEPTRQNAGRGGPLNNVLEVKSSDFEVFEALAMDIAESTQSKEHGQSEVSERLRHRSGSPPGRYTSQVPSGSARQPAGPNRAPPVLPQQLLQVILNRPTDSRLDPNLLPEPEHVMLNHLYALSIKDGVVVLSTIHRYRKKFVTTVMYKPCD